VHLHLGVIYPPVTVISNDGRIAPIKVIQRKFFCGGGDHNLGGLRGCSFRYGGWLLGGHDLGVLVSGVVFVVVFGVVIVIVVVIVFGDSGDVVVFVVILVTCR
jgi:hypothetical protein